MLLSLWQAAATCTYGETYNNALNTLQVVALAYIAARWTGVPRGQRWRADDEFTEE